MEEWLLRSGLRVTSFSVIAIPIVMLETEDDSVGTGILPVLSRQAIPPLAGLSHQSVSRPGRASRVSRMPE